MTLTDFLLARIAEDEAMWRLAEHAGLAFTTRAEGIAAVPPEAFARRMVAECEAKRRIVERAEAQAVCDQHGKVRDSGCGECIASEAVEVADGYVLADLALPYVDHPDYDDSWRP